MGASTRSGKLFDPTAMPVVHPTLAVHARMHSLAWLIACCFSHAAVPASEYDAVIRAAREGRTETAISRLNEWQLSHPGDARIVYDLAAILDMAGRHEEALKYLPRVAVTEAPPYAIKAVARSARIAGRLQEAESAYLLLLGKSPDDMEAHAGLSHVWMAQGKGDSAIEHIRLQQRKTADARARFSLQIALGELHEQRGEWLRAASAFQDALTVEPGFRYAIRGRTFALNRAGAFHLAKRLADKHPGAFDANEMRRLAHDEAAATLVFGEARGAADDGPTRHASTDLALARMDTLNQTYGEKNPTLFDQLLAFRNRGRMQDAVRLHESLLAKRIEIPAYAKAAAADAYLSLEQPEMARDLYLAAIHEAGPTSPLDWQIALLYACVESERHDEAERLADRLMHETPTFMNKGIRGLEAPNTDYARTALVAGLVRLYADRLPEAEQRLAGLRTRAPFNSSYRSAWASLLSARERPRAALEEFTLLQIDDPKSLDAAIGRVDMLLALNRLDDAAMEIRPLVERYPENKAVQGLARRLDSHHHVQLKLDTVFGKGAASAGAESLVNASLHSAPLTESLGSAYRLFSRVSHARGDAGGTEVSRSRTGMGLDYHGPDLRGEIEANKAAGAASRGGIALALSWSLSDAVHARLSADTNVNDLSARAFRAGVTARMAKAGMVWVAHESRHISAEFSRTRFSDSNLRNAFGIHWSERWISGPAFKLETSVSLSRSTNTLAGTDYFNPSEDREAAVAVTAEWMNWRRYQRSFRQRLVYSFGRYWQDGFAEGAVGDLRYEQEWRDDPRWAMRYGLGHAYHPYDGRREHRNYGYMNLHWKMK